MGSVCVFFEYEKKENETKLGFLFLQCNKKVKEKVRYFIITLFSLVQFWTSEYSTWKKTNVMPNSFSISCSFFFKKKKRYFLLPSSFSVPILIVWWRYAACMLSYIMTAGGK